MKKIMTKMPAFILLLALLVPQVTELRAASENSQDLQIYTAQYNGGEIRDNQQFMSDFEKRGDYNFIQLKKQKHPSMFSVGWTALQLGAYATIFEEPVDIYGLNFNVCSSATNNLYGISISGIDNSQTGGVYGASIAYMIFAKRNNYGWTASLINVNYARNYCLTTALLNYGYNSGLQAGAINVGEGVQAGAFNYSFNDNAVQFGAVNLAKSGWQFGLFNYNEKAFFKWMFVFNYSSSDNNAF